MQIRSHVAITLLIAVLAGSAVTASVGPVVAQVDARSPSRVLDTRSGIGGYRGEVRPGAVVRLELPTAAQAGARSVVLNLTSTLSTADGFVSVWPCSGSVPQTSILNFARSRTVANAVVVQLGTQGICMNSSAPTHLIADLTGWFIGEQDFTSSEPNRIIDTRQSRDPLLPLVERRIRVAGTAGIGAQTSAAALNFTVVEAPAAGFLVAYPCGRPTDASTVNFLGGETVANFTLVGLSNGEVCVRSTVTTVLVVDTYGWSAEQGQLRAQTPTRLLDTRTPGVGPGRPSASGDTIQLRIAGRGGVPNDADSAWVTVTAVNPSGDGFVTVWPCDQPLPNASTLNTWPGLVRSNLALVKLSSVDGTACLRYVSSNSTGADLIVDAVGWLSGGPMRQPPTGVGTTTGGGGGPVLWSEDFSSAAGMDRLLKEISVGDNVANGNPMQSFNGDHDHSCGGPTSTRRLVEDYRVSTHFWYCQPGGDPGKGHFMTGINTVGYVIMAFSPLADDGVTARVFPDTATQVCWDQNLTDLAQRKWTQLAVVSADRYRSNGGGINYINPDFNTNGGPRAIHLAGDDFMFVNLRNSVQYFNGQTKVFADYFTDRFQGSTDKATRYTICVRDNGNGTVTRTQTRPQGAVSSITGPGRFPAGPRVFIIEDDSYNPMKAYTDEGTPQFVADPFTWHWDNIRIN